MVSRFTKPQIGQTSSDSKMGVFTADLEDVTSAAPKVSGVELSRLRRLCRFFSASRREGEAKAPRSGRKRAWQRSKMPISGAL